MVEFTHILCPTDLSDASVRPLTYAAALARWYDARLTVLHVVPTFDPMTVRPASLEGTAHIVQPVPHDVVIDGLREVAERAGAGAGHVEYAAEAGDPEAVIVDRALGLGADLVVMGTHARSGLARAMIGSVAEHVLHHAPCPVLMIPPHVTPAAPADVRFRHVLCPMDFSPSAQLAFGFALDLARQGNGEVTLLHAIEWLAEEDPRPHSRFDLPAYRDYLVAEARTRLSELTAGESRAWSGIREEVVSGRPHRQILRIAESSGADLIAMGAQGRGGLGLALFGSTTQQVVRGARCPVLVTRAADPAQPV